MPGTTLDEYTIKARVFPAFLSLLPAFLVMGQFANLKSALLAACSGLSGALLFSFVLAQWSRDAGKRKEEKLWESWGGKPTTFYLRHRSETSNRVLRDRHRERIQRLSTGIVLPTVKEEEADPVEADAHYDTATRLLIARTRDRSRFELLFQENIGYGFRRNCLGLKPIAVFLTAVAFIAALTLLTFNRSPEYNGACVTLSIAAMLIWLAYVNRAWVRRGAETYTERLFAALDSMPELDQLG